MVWSFINFRLNLNYKTRHDNLHDSQLLIKRNNPKSNPTTKSVCGVGRTLDQHRLNFNLQAFVEVVSNLDEGQLYLKFGFT